ncbi:hypothetical protein ACTJK6_08600 [Ralstonia sp. 22086]|uniref:hypothetical protein n=1 Tax=Ralstonia sp. 22086 TaxID=3453870 RepID=UPI003F83CC39
MLSLYVSNLIIPGDPDELTLSTPAGPWKLIKMEDFVAMKSRITSTSVRPAELPVGETYFLENPVAMSNGGAAAVDRAIEELTPVLLAASYATGLSVTVQRATMGSDISIGQATHYWPRVRAMGPGWPVVTSTEQFVHLVEAFVQAWPAAGQTEKARLLIHTWLDALACWSMEDLYLSATTLLQIIAATEATKQGQDLNFYSGVTAAAQRMNIPVLSQDFKKMRNELVHDGQLIGSRFAGPRAACDQVLADVLNWIDQYIHAALSLGPVPTTRCQPNDFTGLNAYSI